LEWNANDPWVLALLGQCLHRQPDTDLAGARTALEKAWSLDPTNGYFVGLLLDVLNDQGDTDARADLLTWAWWRGAPVERWLPGGPDMPAAEAAAMLVSETQTPNARPAAPAPARLPERPLSGRRPTVPAHA
jgi:hypothetical protein